MMSADGMTSGQDASVPGAAMPGGSSGVLEPDEPIRVMGLNSLTYCERLFYLEEVEGILLADEAVYAGRALHEERGELDPSGTELRELEVSSERLGLRGRVDAVRTREGNLVPYEHKRGRAFRDAQGEPTAWPSDALQVAAYAMLLEERFGRPVPEGRVRYHAENVTVRVPLTEELRAAVVAAVARARSVRARLERPPVTDDERRCARCSLAPVCLPEEERFALGTAGEPARLFPAVPDREVVHVMTPGAMVRRSGERLVIRAGDSELESLPIRAVGALVLHGAVQVSAQALQLCLAHDVSVHWLTAGGRYMGSLAPSAGSVQRRLRQYAAVTDPGTALRLARRLVSAKVESQLRFLLRATRGDGEARTAVAETVAVLRAQLKQVARAEGVAALRGYEGVASKAYFAALPLLIHQEMRSLLAPRGRSRRPPRDRFNAALSFGYALLYSRVQQSILAVGLDPALGFYHAPRSAAYPLALDVMELFRVPLWDMPLVASINRRQWSSSDFVEAGGSIWLSDSGRRKAAKLFEDRLAESWKHPVLGYSLSYARTIELEVRLLEKEWTGSPGLFARLRLR
jgi:CRISPR-associated protein Cas1